MKDLVIVGHGGLAKEVTFLIEEINRSKATWKLQGYIASTRDAVGKKSGKYPIKADDTWLAAAKKPLAVVLAIGQPRSLAIIREKFQANRKLSYPNLRHPQSTGDWNRMTQGEGNLVFNGVSFTTSIQLGHFNIFNPGCTVSHDCTFGDFNFFGPGVRVAGEVVIGSRVLLGAGAIVMPRLSIGDDVILGAGAVVVDSITEPGTYVGVPARRLESRSAL
jgi:sugar O-acyltransferase (sialic acid O-acetyltransferase NeuD family)